jgi:hypothetical protein
VRQAAKSQNKAPQRRRIFGYASGTRRLNGGYASVCGAAKQTMLG